MNNNGELTAKGELEALSTQHAQLPLKHYTGALTLIFGFPQILEQCPTCIAFLLNFTIYKALSHSLFHLHPDNKGKEGERKETRRELRSPPLSRLGEAFRNEMMRLGASTTCRWGTKTHSHPAFKFWPLVPKSHILHSALCCLYFFNLLITDFSQ